MRWQILVALAESDLRVHEITQRLAQPQNLVSYHLQKLKQATPAGGCLNHVLIDAVPAPLLEHHLLLSGGFYK